MQEFRQEFNRCWRMVANKPIFLGLFVSWLLLFQFLGNSTFGYIETHSLMEWMYNAYSAPQSDDSHGLLMPFVVVFLFWSKRKDLLSLPQTTWWPALLLLCFAVVLHLFGYAVQQARISIIALFTGIYALIGLTWGWRWLKASFFPFVLFAFSIPIGTIEMMKEITLPLRIFSASIATTILNEVFGFGLLRHGTQIVDAAVGHSYDVTDACSGIRSLISLFVLMLIYGVIAFRSPRKRFVIVLISLPLAIVGNVIRLLSIVISSEMFGFKVGDIVHEWSGFFTYALAIICAMAIGKLWRDSEPEPNPTPCVLEPKTS